MQTSWLKVSNISIISRLQKHISISWKSSCDKRTRLATYGVDPEGGLKPDAGDKNLERITNTSSDAAKMIDEIRASVKTKTGVELEVGIEIW